jgi:hypothetical protein
MSCRLLRLNLIACFLISASASSQAVVIYAIDLHNASGRPVELINEKTGGSWATIAPGRSKSFMYFGGITLRCAGRQLHYTRVDPPKDYISTGLFSVSFKAQLAPDLRIYLLPVSARVPVAHLPSQPKDFPLLPVTRRSNQSLQPTADR